MSTPSSELEGLWQQIVLPTIGHLNGLLVSDVDAANRAWAGLDKSGCRHLLVEVPPGSEIILDRTRGLEVSTEELEIGSHPSALYVDLRCTDPTLNATFSAVVADVIKAIEDPDVAPRQAVVKCLDRWKWFWKTDQAELSHQAALGLFGELWFLSRWVGPVTTDTLLHWTGPARSRHDFQWLETSIEVKCSSLKGGSRPTHRITQLSQLDDPEEGQLHLFSLHVTRDDLAQNSLSRLVDHLTADLEKSDPDAARMFREKLAETGYNPAFADRYDTRYRVVSEALYKVVPGFPRLTPASFVGGLPGGVGDVSYILDMAACETWKVASNPTEFDLPAS